ncbi:alpha/beta fold hydrolase [Cytophagaceae bacterium DM2B3-1]|uniref:Alpha/beta fold hydrolase n=1 Tax=Xanthocytophaga flava TaxID=3048013 RepID=A0ABT7CGZ9_9BACT|nr:alpha/beta fold hydrolase [Xanthocytophaga flavus]MDJ1471032.1 alpha/beta fold hydrolase [Xanthocytophaga flavus]MDJ1492985.1 alpha/beta fold hydrolase [Xanthocytophaga flavus]
MYKTILSLFFLLLSFQGCRSIDEPGTLVPPTTDQDPALSQISVNVAGHTRSLHCFTYGDPQNPPLFVLHGSYDEIRSYRVLQILSDKYYVVMWSQRGCGLSERITESEFTFDSQVEEVEQVKALFAPDRPITLYAHSMGGGTAAMFTARHPDQVRQLILGEPLVLQGSAMDKIWKDLVEFDYTNTGWNEMAQLNDALPAKTHEELDYRALMMLKSNMTKYFCDRNNPPDWPVWRIGGFVEMVRNKRIGNAQSGFSYDFSIGLKDYPNQVLIMGGTCSGLGFANQTTYNQPLFANAKVIKIENAGHRYLAEQFEQTIQAMKGYLYEYQ